MSPTRTPASLPCERARRALQDTLDGTLPPGEGGPLEAHLEACGECREYRDEILAVREGLLALPEVPLPDDALEEVWSRTLEAGAPAARSARRWGWLAAAAAVLVAALVWLLTPIRPSEPAPTEEELGRAAAETRLVLALTAQAFRRTEDAAVGGVLAGEVSPALHQIPLNWPEGPPPQERRPGP